MRKVEKITEEVIENEQEVKELLSKQSIEDLYEFFLAKDSTLTEEEFNDEVYDILEYYLKNISKEIKKLEENETKQIVGGKSDIIKKSLSASLCLLTLTSGINASASPTSVNPSSQKAVSVWNNKKQEKSVTFGEKIKAWVKKNKKALIITGSVTAAVIAGIIITVVVYKNKKNVKQPKDNINVPINQRPAEQSNNNSEKSTTRQSKNLEQSPSTASNGQTENFEQSSTESPATTPAVQPKKDEKSPSTASNGQTENFEQPATESSATASAVQPEKTGQHEKAVQSPTTTPVGQAGNNTRRKLPTKLPPAANSDGQSGQGTSKKSNGESEMWEEGRVERLRKDLNKFSSENASDGKTRFRSIVARGGSANASGGKPRSQSVAARGPANGSTGDAASASGGRPRFQSVAARGPTNSSANASGGKPRFQSVVVGSTGGAESVSDGEHRANERYVAQTSAALAGDAKNVVNPDQVQGARDFFEKLGIGTGAPGDSLTSGQMNTAKIAGIFSAKRNFNANHLKTVGRFNVAVGNFDNSMKSLKLQMDDKGLQQRVVLNLDELKSALDSMNDLQKQLGYSYLNGIGDDVRSGLERNLEIIEKAFRESHAIFDDLFKDQIKNIENMGKVIKELQENPLFVAQGDRLGALGQKF